MSDRKRKVWAVQGSVQASWAGTGQRVRRRRSGGLTGGSVPPPSGGVGCETGEVGGCGEPQGERGEEHTDFGTQRGVEVRHAGRGGQGRSGDVRTKEGPAGHGQAEGAGDVKDVWGAMGERGGTCDGHGGVLDANGTGSGGGVAGRKGTLRGQVSRRARSSMGEHRSLGTQGVPGVCMGCGASGSSQQSHAAQIGLGSPRPSQLQAPGCRWCGYYVRRPQNHHLACSSQDFRILGSLLR